MSVVSDAVRSQVRKRANQRCEYCHLPDKVSIYGYHVDHIIPLIHGGTSSLDNLAWACMECNINKGRDVSSYDEITGLLTPLFNPRTNHWHEHFEFQDGFILPVTAQGCVTVRVLSMNQSELVETRRNLIDAHEW